MPPSTNTDPDDFIALAATHLERVRKAAPISDWMDLGTYGLYCLEALVRAAAMKSGETPIRTHYGKADQSNNLAQKHGLPKIDDLLRTLNTARKSEAYGDEEFAESDYDAKHIATEIENYFDAVKAFCSKA
jgi:hypothetical protein